MLPHLAIAAEMVCVKDWVTNNTIKVQVAAYTIPCRKLVRKDASKSLQAASPLKTHMSCKKGDFVCRFPIKGSRLSHLGPVLSSSLFDVSVPRADLCRLANLVCSCYMLYSSTRSGEPVHSCEMARSREEITSGVEDSYGAVRS